MTGHDEPSGELQAQWVAQLSELAGGLAHELRNPLSTMKVNLKLLAEDLADEEARPEDVRRRALLKVDVLRREADRLQALFDDFLNLTGVHELERTLVDLDQVVERMITFFEPMATSHGITIRAMAPGTPLACRVDEKLLSTALLNLVVNATDAMPQGGTLTIEASRDGHDAVIAVSDTGIGMPPEILDRVFRPFFSNKASGTGLGLALTRRIVREHGGRLSVQSTVGAGSTFTIRLPLSDEGADVGAAS